MNFRREALVIINQIQKVYNETKSVRDERLVPTEITRYEDAQMFAHSFVMTNFIQWADLKQTNNLLELTFQTAQNIYDNFYFWILESVEDHIKENNQFPDPLIFANVLALASKKEVTAWLQ